MKYDNNKNICCEVISKHTLGCTLELEIYDLEGNDAEGIGTSAGDKKCIICGGKASICKRRKTHSKSELITRMNNIYIEYTNSYHGKNC